MSTHYVVAPNAGVVLASVLSADRSPVTVYSDAGRTTPVTLPLTLTGVTTVYVADVVTWVASVTTPDGLVRKWTMHGTGAETLTFVLDTPARTDIECGTWAGEG